VRQSKRVALGLGAVAILVGLAFWLTAGVSGEVFIVSPEGKPEVAPGAQVRVYRSDGQHSLSAFLGTVDPQKTLTEVDAEFPHSPPGLPDSDMRMNLVRSMAYMQISVKVSQYWQTLVVLTTTDKNGNFSVRLLPGTYVIHVSGQAGRQQAHWLTEVHVIWRSETRLSLPIYTYNAATP
jgi:hypothetical protein